MAAPSRPSSAASTHPPAPSSVSRPNSPQPATDRPTFFRSIWAEQRSQVQNNPNARFELFILDPGEKKIETKEDTKVPNTQIFTFNKEDHTLGNLISQRLLKYPHVTFAAYKVPHPLFATFDLRVTTDGSVSPKDAVVMCCKDVIADLSKVSLSFQQEWMSQKIIAEGQRDAEVRDQGGY